MSQRDGCFPRNFHTAQRDFKRLAKAVVRQNGFQSMCPVFLKDSVCGQFDAFRLNATAFQFVRCEIFNIGSDAVDCFLLLGNYGGAGQPQRDSSEGGQQ